MSFGAILWTVTKVILAIAVVIIVAAILLFIGSVAWLYLR
jgi:hypothetical protein